jgi:hypothetical protein
MVVAILQGNLKKHRYGDIFLLGLSQPWERLLTLNDFPLWLFSFMLETSTKLLNVKCGLRVFWINSSPC